jgi:hypothetical protein
MMNEPERSAYFQKLTLEKLQNEEVKGIQETKNKIA